jgi:deoxyribonuclease-4
MFRIGAHVSISDGLDAAVKSQVELDGTCGQLFVGSPRTWAVSEMTDEDAEAFGAAVEENEVRPWICHGTYLINFATPKDDLAAKSLDCVQAELDACAALDIPYYTFHPGAHTGSGADAGVGRVADRLSALDVPEETMVLLENTAGKGTTVGQDFDQLARMMTESDLDRDEVGVCLDSCHLFAAGHDFSADGIDDTIAALEGEFDLDRVHYLHLNDSKHPFGSEKDEHAHIGEGEIGAEPFRTLINHDAFRDLPMVLETPVEDGKGYAWNIERVKELRES